MPPTLFLSLPEHGSLHRESTFVMAVATADDVDGVVAQVTFAVDGIQQHVDLFPPFEAALALDLGSHEVSAIATDDRGAEVRAFATVLIGTTIWVPGDASTIQTGIDMALDGDHVMVAPGTYYENLYINGKSIVLASLFLDSGDSLDVVSTIVDGGGGTVLHVGPSVGAGTTIQGLTLQNGDDGILVESKVRILDNRILSNADGIDYEGGGGLCAGNFIFNNSDDGIDLDGPVAVTIENNRIDSNNDDGIEIRLHPYSGPNLDVLIRGNWITGSGEDGIQFIDYDDLSDRIYRLESNLIEGSALAAVGFMGNGVTIEDLHGELVPERVYLIHTTIVDNGWGVTGGGNLVMLNNVIAGTANVALRNATVNSISAYNLFWNNGTDHEGSNVDLWTTIVADPLLLPDRTLGPGSVAIDAGTISFLWLGEEALSPTEFAGVGPDLGAFEAH